MYNRNLLWSNLVKDNYSFQHLDLTVSLFCIQNFTNIYIKGKFNNVKAV